MNDRVISPCFLMENCRENVILGQGEKNHNICGIGPIRGKHYFREVGIADGLGHNEI